MPSEALVTLAAMGAVAVVLLSAFAILFLRLASRFDPAAAEPGWMESFSLDRYAPMERLLDASDFEFLAKRSPGNPRLAKKLLAERRGIFREYLSMLVRDFNELHLRAKEMLVGAPEDRPEFAGELFRQQLRFYFSVCLIRCKVTLYPLGWTALDVPRLLGALERLRDELHTSLPVPASEAGS
jgi:hypothetical protein